MTTATPATPADRAPDPTELDVPDTGRVDPVAQQVITELGEARLTIATAESLTGGRVCALLTSVPGSSAVVLGGVVSYSTDLKARVLGVSSQVLREQGAVAADTAQEMAWGVRRVTGSTIGVATTGVAGPEPSEGKPVGTVFIAVALGESEGRVRALTLHGSREQICRQSVESALALVLEVLREREGGPQERDGQAPDGPTLYG